MIYSLADYTIILKECKLISDISVIREAFNEDISNYTAFQIKMIKDIIAQKEKILKK